MLVKSVAHYRQAKCIASFTFANHVPACQVAFSDIDHVTDHVAHFPFAAARLDVPGIWIVNDVVEFSALGACYIEYRISTTVIHWIDRHRSLLLMCDVLSFQRQRMFWNTSLLLLVRSQQYFDLRSVRGISGSCFLSPVICFHSLNLHVIHEDQLTLL